MKKVLSLVLILILVLTISGCAAQQDDGKIKIVTTIFPEYDFARAVVGANGHVSMLIPAGSDMHSFEPTAQDLANISESDLFIYVGGKSDKWVEKVLENINKRKTKVLKLSDVVSFGDEGEYDEHIWTSPSNAAKIINAISESICEIDEENDIFYERNAEKYIDEIVDVAELTKIVIAAAKHKKIVVADRFPLKYFTEYYGLEYTAAFGGCEHDTDADVETVAHLINDIKKDKLSAVFHIELSNKNLAETVAKSTGVEVIELHSAHNISAEDYKKGVTYVDIMKRNAYALEKGLN